MRSTMAPLILCGLGLWLGGCSLDFAGFYPPLPTVPELDLARYAGKWYEIARYPNWFERGCEGVTAEYTPRDDGSVGVLNICRNADGEYRELMARLMAAAVETGDEKVIAGKSDARIDAKLVADVNARLKGEGKGRLTLADEKHNFGGGFLLQRGKIRTNVSLAVLVEQARKDLEIEVA